MSPGPEMMLTANAVCLVALAILKAGVWLGRRQMMHPDFAHTWPRGYVPPPRPVGVCPLTVEERFRTHKPGPPPGIGSLYPAQEVSRLLPAGVPCETCKGSGVKPESPTDPFKRGLATGKPACAQCAFERENPGTELVVADCTCSPGVRLVKR